MKPNGLSLVLLLVALTVGWYAMRATSAGPVDWESIDAGLEIGLWDPGSSCRNEVPGSVLMRIDPDRFRFAIYHYRDEGLDNPLTVQEWQQRTRAQIIFNAGLFRGDYSYMGLLFKEGRALSPRRHPQWQGLFVAEPVVPGLKKARVLDLAREPFVETQPLYREVAQSLMLLDRAGKPRVRRSGKRAYQMVVGEDRAGRILLVRPRHEVALWDLAECLREQLPSVIQAMAMDGGSSAELLLAPELLEDEHGSRQWASLVNGTGMGHIALPSVIGVLAR